MKFRSLMTAICVLATANIVSAAPFAYIANSGTHNVTVIDTANNTIKATVPLPDSGSIRPYAYGVAVGASGQYAYVGLQDTNEVVVIDTTKAVGTAEAHVKRIGLGGDSPGGLAVNAAETRLYVASNKSNTLIVIDITGTGAAEVGRVTVDPDSTISNPEGVVLSPDGLKAYVANSSKGTIAEIALDETNNVYTRTTLISLGNNSQPMGLTINSTGTKLYAASLGNTASVVDTATRAVTDLLVNTGNLSLAITPDNSKIYAPSSGFNNMYWINGANNAVTALGGQNSLLNSPWGSSVTPVGANKLYVTMNLSDNVNVFDTSTDLVTATINLPVGAKPTSMGDFIGPNMPYTITSAQGANCNILPLGVIPVNDKGRIFSIFPTINQCEVFTGCNINDLNDTIGRITQGFPSKYAFTSVPPSNTICAVPVSSGTYYTLSGDWISSIGGWLVSTSAGINQSSKSASFITGSTVTLTVGDSVNHKIQDNSWTGDCFGTVGQICTLANITAAKTFGAIVIDKPSGPAWGPIYCVTKTIYYQTFTEMVAAAATGDTMKIASSLIAGGTTNGTAVNIILSSGWNPEHTTPSSSTMGPLIIGTTAVIVDPTVGYKLTI